MAIIPSTLLLEDFGMKDAETVIDQFLSADPIEGDKALHELVALRDAGEEALFAKCRPYPELCQQQRRWLRYVVTREATILNRLIGIIRDDKSKFSRYSAAFLFAGISDVERAQSGIFEILKSKFNSQGSIVGDYYPLTDIFVAWGYSGGSANTLWNYVSEDNYAWDKLRTFAFRAACASFARVNEHHAWALEQLVTHASGGFRPKLISTDPEETIPNSAVDPGELWLQAYRTFIVWRRGEVADKVLRDWSGHEHWRVRSFGAEILAALGFSRIVTPVVEWLRHEAVSQVRRNLLSALERSATQEGADVLLDYLETRQADGLDAAVRGVWRSGDKDRARRALLGLGEEVGLTSKAESLVSLARLGQAHPHLTQLLHSPQPYVRANAALAYAYLGDHSVRSRLVQMQKEAAEPMETIMLAAALSMLGEASGGLSLHRALVAGAAAEFPKRVDMVYYKSTLQEAVLAGLAANGEESRPYLEAWRADLAPLDLVAQPILLTAADTSDSHTKSIRTPVPDAGSGVPRKAPLKVFVSYSHRDQRMRERLGDHLSTLETQGIIQIWHDREIEPAANWEGEINREIQEADVVLLLVSASFIKSRYCQRELKYALDLRAKRNSLAIPIILRPCDWESVFNLPDYKTQALPRDNRPIAGPRWLNQDAAFDSVARELRRLFEKMLRTNVSP